MMTTLGKPFVQYRAVSQKVKYPAYMKVFRGLGAGESLRTD